MSVLVKGMNMPKHLDINGDHDSIFRGVIVVHKDGTAEFVVNLAGESTFARCNNSQLERFPCVDVPTPHGGLIDEDTNVGSYVETWICNCSEFGVQRVMAVDDLRYLPTVIEAEALKEREGNA